MEKYTQLVKKESEGKAISDENDKVLYQDEYITIRSLNGWSMLEEKDNVCCIPIFIEKNKIFLRKETVPSYNKRDSQEYHLTVISGTIETDETPDMTLRRELVEEAGIVLNDNYKINFLDCLFKSKSGTAKMFIALIPLSESDYSETYIKGDGSKEEKNSQTVSIDIKFINSLFPADLVTRLLLLETKSYLNLK